MLMKLTPAINFINVIHARFLYEFFDKAKKVSRKMMFVQKIRTYIVDEIDNR